MKNSTHNKNKSNNEWLNNIYQQMTLQLATFSILVLILGLTITSCIRIYYDQIDTILRNLKQESSILRIILNDNLDYLNYFLEVMAKDIQKNPKDLHYINDVLQKYSSHDSNQMDKWHHYSWIDNKFYERVSSAQGVLKHPKYLPLISKIIYNHNKLNIPPTQNNARHNLVYFTKNIFKNRRHNLVYLAKNIFKNRKYIGSISLAYDIDPIMNQYNSKYLNEHVEFTILDQDFKIVTQSHQHTKGFITNNKLHKNIKRLLKTNLTPIGSNYALERHENQIVYLDVLNGVNYHIYRLQTMPLIMITSFDHKIIANNIISILIRKIIEIAILCFGCMFIILLAYKREIYLRNHRKNSTRLVNNANKATTDFLVFTAHEIRSPLGFIMTGSEIMTKNILGKLPKQYTEYAQGINDNAKLILRFIDDILNEQQIMQGAFNLKNNINDITEIINKSIDINTVRYKERYVRIKKILDDDLPLLICDNIRILQILNNLISNSIKYSKDGTEIAIKCYVTNNEMHLVIKDDGMGMEQSQVSIALSTYGILSKNDHYSNNSYGVGLAVVKKLIEAHEARYTIQSKKNIGTTISIIFPTCKLVSNSSTPNAIHSTQTEQ